MPFHFDFVDLQLFVNIVETQSLTHGAGRSFISAPAASTRIKKLEESMGIQLFYRTAQGLAPTPAAEIFLKHARGLLRQVEQLNSELPMQGGGAKGNIRVFANTLSINGFIPQVLQRFMRKYPQVNIDLRERPSSDIVRAVKEGAADIGVLSSDTAIEGLRFLAYRAERLVLITARNHPLSGAGPVQFSQTLGDDYIGLKETTALHMFIKDLATRLGASLKFRIQVDTFEVLCNLVESGIGVALVPESVAKRQAESLAIEIVPLRDDWAERILKVAVRDGQLLSAIESALVDELIASTDPCRSANALDI